MRRAAPPQMMRVDPTDPGPWARVGGGSRGLGLEPAPAPDGGDGSGHVVLRPARGVPFATHEAVIVNDGALALTAAPGVARTLRLPDMANLFDRRPPGLAHVVGAPDANAGLLCDDSGWRSVVLPSMGDLVADLGSGPVAIRADGRRVAVVHAGGTYELEVPGGATTQLADVPATALAYRSDGTLAHAAGGLVGSTETGVAVTAICVASRAARMVTGHTDGSVRVWDGADTSPRATWVAPQGAAHLALSPDGEHVALSTIDGDTPAAWVVRVADGVPVRRIIGARVIAFDPQDRGLLVGGDWGALWMEPPREAQ